MPPFFTFDLDFCYATKAVLLISCSETVVSFHTSPPHVFLSRYFSSNEQRTSERHCNLKLDPSVYEK